MAHDDRIRQLSDLFIEDLRTPIEASLRQLLSQLMAIATQEQAVAIEQALARAATEHTAALAAAAEFATQQRDLALEALEAALVRERDATAQQVATERAAEQAADEERSRQHTAALAAAVEFATQQRDLALETLEADLQREHEATATLEADLQREHEATARLEADLQREHEATATLEADLQREHEAAVQGEAGLLRERQAALDAWREQLEQEHAAALASIREEMRRDKAEALDALREQLEQEQQTRLETAWPPGQTPAPLESVVQERDTARATVAELTDQLANARAQHEQLLQLAHAESAAAEQATAVSIEARAEERQSELACSERVLSAVRHLDEARTLTEILTVLADHAASEATRVAVLLVQGGCLRGWRVAGMGDVQPNTIDIPLERAGVIGRAVATVSAVATTEVGEAPADGLPSFLVAPPARVGLALPIVVGGRVVAILYADDAAAETPRVPSNWPEVAEVLARHAGRCLEVLTLARATGVAAHAPREERPPVPARAVTPPATPGSVRENDEAQEEESARRHARLLISEIKLYNEIRVEQGRREGNLLALLATEIDRARRLYEEKIPAAVRQRVDCFDEEIVRTLAGGDSALLGQVT